MRVILTRRNVFVLCSLLTTVLLILYVYTQSVCIVKTSLFQSLVNSATTAGLDGSASGLATAAMVPVLMDLSSRIAPATSFGADFKIGSSKMNVAPLSLGGIA